MIENIKTVIIGGSSGMGLAIARKLHLIGHEIAIASRSKEKLEKAKALIGKADTHVLDAENEDELAAFFQAIGPFDHLVTSAAGFVMGPFLTLSTADAKRFFDSKFWSQYAAAKHAASQMRTQGSITFFCGTAGQRPFLNFAAGSAINAAIEGLTRALALELSPLRVNAIAPGMVETPVWDAFSKEERLQEFEETAKRLPVKKIGKAEDVAEAAHYLIQCSYATGSVVYVDGGGRLV